MFARIVLIVRDADGDTAPCSIRFFVADASTLVDTAEDYAHTFYDVVSQFITGSVIECLIEIEPDTSAWVGFDGIPAVASDVEEKVHVIVRSTARGAAPFRFSIPTIDETYFTNGGAGKVLDITQADVLALYALLTEDVSSGGIDAVDFHGSDLVQVMSSQQAFIARGRR